MKRTVSIGYDLPVGTELLGYRIEGVLGRGGMGIVYLAEDLRLKRKVALKLLSPELAEDEQLREQLLTESEVAASIDHPNIVPIYAAGNADGRIFLSMRYVPGSTLKALLAQGPLAPEQTLALISQVGRALDAAHARDLVHRDVKPSNVLIAPDSGTEGTDHVYLADFGLTRRVSEQAVSAEHGQLMGTVHYVAPEQIRGDVVDGRADIYALGCVLFECLAGEPPFRGRSDVALLFAHLQEMPEPVTALQPELPDAVDGVILRALEKDPADRYQTAQELVDSARAALGLTLHRRPRWPVAVAAVGLLTIGVVMLSFFLTRSEPGVSAEPDADALVHIDPTSNKVSDTMPAGRAASAVAVGDGFVWVTNAGDGNVWRIDPQTRAVIKIPTRGSPVDVAVGRGEVLVANGPEHSLTAIDARTGELRFTSTLGAAYSVGSLRVVGDGGGVWFADPTTNQVGRESAGLQGGFLATQIAIPPDGSKVAGTYEDFADFSVGEGALWVAGDTLGRTLWKLDARARKLVATVRLPFIPAGVAAGEGAVWVTSLLDDTVTRLNSSTNRIVRTIRVGRGAGSVATGHGAVWVVNGIDGTVSRVDPRANRVVATIPIGNTPGDIAVGPDGLWVTATDAAPAAVPESSIPIGVLSDCRGSYSQTRTSTLAGAELALIERGGTRAGTALIDGVEGVSIAGHSITLYFGCSDSATGSALSEARRLVDGIGVRVLIGPLSGTQGLALQDFARRRPGVAFVNGTSSALLQHPAPNFFSFHTDGAGWTAGLGTYAYRTLGWRRAVVVADLEDDLFNWTQAAGFVAEFCSLGGSVAKRVWVPAGIRDYSSVVSELPKSGVDGFFMAAYPETIVALANAYPGLAGSISRRLIPGTFADLGGLEPLGDRTKGMVGGAAGGAGDWDGYLRRLRRAFPELKDTQGSYFDIFYYDAMAATLEALTAVQGDVSGDERRFKSALARVRLNSALGPIRLDRSHQAVAYNSIFGDGRLLRSIPGVDHTFGGYFTPNDPPPSRTTPACVKRRPPPWAR